MIVRPAKGDADPGLQADRENEFAELLPTPFRHGIPRGFLDKGVEEAFFQGRILEHNDSAHGKFLGARQK